MKDFLKVVAVLLLVVPAFEAFAGDPDCSGTDGWPTSMAFVRLKNAGLTDNDELDFSKTRAVKLVSEKIGKNLYRQVHYVKFMEKSGNVIAVITVSDASSDECSLGDVEVFVVSQQLGAEQTKKTGIVKEENKTNKKGSEK